MTPISYGCWGGISSDVALILRIQAPKKLTIYRAKIQAGKVMEVVYENQTCKIIKYSGHIDALGPYAVPSSTNEKIAQKYKYIRFNHNNTLETITDLIVHYGCDPEIKIEQKCNLYIYTNKLDSTINTVIGIETGSSKINDLETFRNAQAFIKQQVDHISKLKIKLARTRITHQIILLPIAAIFIIPAIFLIISIHSLWKTEIQTYSNSIKAIANRYYGIPPQEAFNKILSLN